MNNFDLFLVLFAQRRKEGDLQAVGQSLLRIWQLELEQDRLTKPIKADRLASIWQVCPEVTTQAEAVGGKSIFKCWNISDTNLLH